jgi:hypothetical protein
MKSTLQFAKPPVISILAAKKWVLYLILLSAVSSTDCARHIAGGAVTWENGTLNQGLNADIADIHQAVLNALKELEMDIIEETKDLDMSQITSQYDDVRRVWIEIRSLKTYGMEGTKHDLRPEARSAPLYKSDISIRVEDIGDKQKAYKLLETMHRYL